MGDRYFVERTCDGCGKKDTVDITEIDAQDREGGIPIGWGYAGNGGSGIRIFCSDACKEICRKNYLAERLKGMEIHVNEMYGYKA